VKDAVARQGELSGRRLVVNQVISQVKAYHSGERKSYEYDKATAWDSRRAWVVVEAVAGRGRFFYRVVHPSWEYQRQAGECCLYQARRECFALLGPNGCSCWRLRKPCVRTRSRRWMAGLETSEMKTGVIHYMTLETCAAG